MSIYTLTQTIEIMDVCRFFSFDFKVRRTARPDGIFFNVRVLTNLFVKFKTQIFEIAEQHFKKFHQHIRILTNCI